MSTPIILTRDQTRRVDRLAAEEYGFSGLVLMENAGRGVADVLCRLGIAGPVVDLLRQGEQRRRRIRHRPAPRPARPCGPRAAVGRAGRIDRRRRGQFPYSREDRRADRGFRRGPRRRAAGESCSTGRPGSSMRCWGPARGEPRPPFDAVIEQLNAAAAPRLAVDLPSGLDCDTGVPGAAHDPRRRDLHAAGRQTGLFPARGRPLRRPPPRARHRRAAETDRAGGEPAFLTASGIVDDKRSHTSPKAQARANRYPSLACTSG